MAIMHGQVTTRNTLALDPTRQFGALQSFGNAFLSRFEASFLPSPVLKSITLIETPGILSGEKQSLHRGYFNFLVFKTQEKLTKFQVRIQSTDRMMLPPTLSLCILLLIFRLLLQSGDVEANPGPTLGKRCLLKHVCNCSSDIHTHATMHVCALSFACNFVASILTLDDLNSVYKNLIKAAGNWFSLGLDLGLDFDALNDISDKHRDNKTRLCNIIAARLKTGPLTYSEICQSLKASTVGRNDVAEAIEEECTGTLIMIRLLQPHYKN